MIDALSLISRQVEPPILSLRSLCSPMNTPPPGVAWILGAGISGQAAAALLLHRGWRVTVLDSADEAKIGEAVRRLCADGATVRCSAFSLPDGPVDCVVVSPGMAADAPLREDAIRRGMSLWSELELGARFLRCPMIAVTGSKGKSSLVKVIADTITLSGRRAAPGGNFGTAISTLADERPELDWAVVECSSFQLETVDTFCPRIGIILNLSPDHLDRHGTMESYRDTKLRMLVRQSADDVALLPSGPDPWELVRAYEGLTGRRPELFGAEAEAVWRYTPGTVAATDGRCPAIDIAGSPFDNPILGRAAAAGVAALWHAGVEPAVISRGFTGYAPLVHRMQLVAEIGGVRYINDSKATSLTAQLAAVRMLQGPSRLIAGGRLKEKITANAKELLTAGVKKAYLIGECAGEMAAAWSPDLNVQVCGTLEAAVECAGRETEPGETVLLSPGTASFDQFRDFQDRGDQFMALVEGLQETTE